MRQQTEKAYAKLNLTLDVLGQRADGYHELRMIMQSVSLCDEVTLTLEEGTGVQLCTDWGFLPTDGKNIAVSAANAFARATGVSVDGLRIQLKKNIPVCAGTAGGSSDGAAVLRGLNRLFDTKLTLAQLAKIGEQVGSDVPYCVVGGTMLAEGRGEILNALPDLPHCWIVMCKPTFSISTPELFHRIDSVKVRCRPDTQGMLNALEQQNLCSIARQMYNVFEDVLPANRSAVIREIRNTMIQGGALGSCLSGTGPTTFGIFDDEATAQAVVQTLSATYKDVFLTEPVGTCAV